MPLEPVELAAARVLISNDDGLEAEGIRLLERLITPLVAEVWVVAPDREQSGSGHALTLNRPLRVKQAGERRFAVDGTPTDCILLGVQELMAGRPPHLILSGINGGGNLGEDVTYSGTVAVAMEGALMGIRSIALSQDRKTGTPTQWGTAEAWVVRVIELLSGAPLAEGAFFNVNFPNLPLERVTGIAVATQGRRKIGSQIERRADPRGHPYFWIGPGRIEDATLDGTDLEASAHGMVTVTPLTTDLTHWAGMDRLRGLLS